MLKKLFIIFSVLTLSFFCLSSSVYAVVTGTASEGWRIFDCHEAGLYCDYRYGPSIIINNDNSIDMWMASPGNYSDEWDYIRYKRSTDGGHTWSAEQIVLTPTPGSSDRYSICDPGVVKFGGYYYIGYTSVDNIRGASNHVFVARSTSPTGPFEKWNGSGWGGNPQPFIVYDDGPYFRWGIGEPSFVVKDDTLYIYYSWYSQDSNGKPKEETRVRTASITDPNWPGNTTYQGVAIHRVSSEDSTDVKYVDSLQKFIGVSTASRFGALSFVNMWESEDGITFTPSNLDKKFLQPFAHNIGISGTETGHLDTAKNNFIAYAYGQCFGFFHMYLNPISLSSDNLPAIPEIFSVHPDNGQVKLHFETVPDVDYTIKYGTSSGTYTSTITGVTSSPYIITGLTNGTAYYFAVAAHNSYGDSANSSQVSSMPLNYTVSPRTSVTASSSEIGWDASKAIDDSIYTMWSSGGHTSGDYVEWIYVDTGAERAIKRVTLTPRLMDGTCYPSKMKIQVSKDAVNWTTVNYTWYTGGDSEGNFGNEAWTPYSNYGGVYTLDRPAWGRYVRIYSGALSYDANFNYYCQLGDIKIEHVDYSAAASSISDAGWKATNAIDWDSSRWSSLGHASANFTEWIYIDTGISGKVTGVRLQPRTDCPGNGFPVDFKFQSSNDGVNWSDIAGQSYTNYPNPGSTLQTFKFGSPVTARYIRLYATKLGTDIYGNYYAQIQEFFVDSMVQRTAAASSAYPDWPVNRVADNLNSPWWCSIGHASPNFTEWVSVDLGTAQYVNGIKLVPRPDSDDLCCFPEDFRLEYSMDGSTWSTIPRQVYNNYDNTYKSRIQYFRFSNPVNARYLRVYATKLRPDGYGNYYFQLSEFYIEP